MKITIVAVLVVMSLLFETVMAAAGATGYVSIKRIRIGDGYLRVTTETDFVDPSSCFQAGSNLSHDVIVSGSVPSYREIVSFVLSAKMTNTPIQFWIKDCATDSGNQYPSATFAYIE